jgi:hypothetical protein
MPLGPYPGTLGPGSAIIDGVGLQRHVNQMREEFPSREQAEAYRATRSLTEPGVNWVLFPLENGRWAVARAEPQQQATGESG